MSKIVNIVLNRIDRWRQQIGRWVGSWTQPVPAKAHKAEAALVKREEMGTHPGKGKDASRVMNEGSKTPMVRAEEYLRSRYAFRFNRMTKEYEWATLEKPTDFHRVDDATYSDFVMQLQREGINLVHVTYVRTIISCARTPSYDPLDAYLAHLPAWDGVDRIEELFRRVTDDEQVLAWLHCWFLGLVAQATGRQGRYGNSLCPLLISERQGWGKSQFTKLIVPPELGGYYTDHFNLAQEEACLRRMAVSLVINLDEFDRYSEKQHASLKRIIQEADIRVKRSYRAQFEVLRRRASFIGTSNQRYLLSDPSGSRRYICVELSHPIDVERAVDHAQLYAQAVHELDQGMPYWLEGAQLVELERHNAPYRVERAAEQLLKEHFVPVEPSRTMDDDDLWPAAAVYDYLNYQYHGVMRSIERSTFGMYIKAMGFAPVRRKDKRYYAMALR